MPEPVDVNKRAAAAILQRADMEDNQALRAIIPDLEYRAMVGEEKYGTRLYSSNGRDALVDLYEELLDAFVYAVQLDIESAKGWSVLDPIISSLDAVVYLLNQRELDKGFLRNRAPQPAPLFEIQ